MSEETRGEFDSRDARINHEKEVAARRELVSSTQEEYPWRAAIRTGVQVLAGLIVALLAAVPIIVETIGDLLPDTWIAWLVGFAGVLTAVSTLVARLMAAEPVLAFVGRWAPWLAPKRIPSQVVHHEEH